MLVLGINCGFNTTDHHVIPAVPRWFFHDSGAALVRDGQLLAAVEEERLTRVKHTNTFSAESARACFQTMGLDPASVDRVAFSFREDYADNELNLQFVERPALGLARSRDLIAAGVSESLGIEMAKVNVRYVEHHLAHAYAAYFHSGFSDALVVIVDGNGEEESATVFSASGYDIEKLASLPVEASLGHLYSTAIQLVGYGLFDEYKVMGLAPYGEPARYGAIFSSLYELRDDGGFELDYTRVRSAFLRAGFRPRRSREPFTTAHRDFAAGLQEMLERLVLHMLSYWRRATGHRHLSMGGGVVHNCSMNGRVLRSGLFDAIFAHPVAHDAGTSAGAALRVCHELSPERFEPAPLRHLYWGPHVGDETDVQASLARWEPMVSWYRSDDVYMETGAALADGEVIAWVQGRSEWGPRALGHRSIIADPRPEANRQRLNDVVKKREGFRPFAPAVLEEVLADWFTVPSCGASLDHMIYVVEVRPDKRKMLGAVTHIDGTARVQTVNLETNVRFWRLISEFAHLTGVPVVLNTSFNNAFEPIVQTVDEALSCLLTTTLDALVVGECVVRRAPDAGSWCRHLAPELVAGTELRRSRSKSTIEYTVGFKLDGAQPRTISRRTAALLESADGRQSLESLVASSDADQDRIQTETRDLWERRLVRMTPIGMSE